MSQKWSLLAELVSNTLERKDPSVLKFFAKLQFNRLTCLGLIAKVTQAFDAPFPSLRPNDLIFHRALGRVIHTRLKPQTNAKRREQHHMKEVFGHKLVTQIPFLTAGFKGADIR